jgi:hypothetical protein
MNRCGDQVRAAGGSYRHFEDAGYGNWAFTWPFKNVGTLNQLLQASSSLCNTGSSASSADGSLTASDTDFFKVTETTGLITNTFHATGQMSMLSSAGSIDPSTQQLLKDARESFAITFPGYVSAHAGGILNGNSVTYTIHYGESTTIDATGGGVNTGTVAAATGLALVVLASLVAIFFVMRRRVPAESIPVGLGTEYVSVPTLSALGGDEPTVPLALPQDGQPHSDV